jgi:hypothetical protein
MKTDRRATDRAPDRDQTAPWWITLILLALFLLPVLFGSLEGKL